MTKKVDDKKPEGAQEGQAGTREGQEGVAPPESTETTPKAPEAASGGERTPPKTLSDLEVWQESVFYKADPPKNVDFDEIVRTEKENELPAVCAMVGRKVIGVQQLEDGTIGLILRDDTIQSGDVTLWIKSEPLGGPGFAAFTPTPKN